MFPEGWGVSCGGRARISRWEELSGGWAQTETERGKCAQRAIGGNGLQRIATVSAGEGWSCTESTRIKPGAKYLANAQVMSTFFAMKLDAADIAYFKRGEVENPTFWWRLGGKPIFTGLDVLDVGCGLGSLCVDMAAGGAARVVGLDTETKLIEFAKQYAAETYPQYKGVLEFYDHDLKHSKDGLFDVVVSKDSFEHIMDLDGMLREMAARLKPGGRIYAGFGPLYNSPFGHHGRVATFLPWRKFPWAHLVEREEKIVARLNKIRSQGGKVFTYSDAPITSIRDLGLSMYSLADYRRMIYGSGLKVTRFGMNRSKSPLSKVLSVLRRVPFLEEYCTHSIYCILEKPA